MHGIGWGVLYPFLLHNHVGNKKCFSSLTPFPFYSPILTSLGMVPCRYCICIIEVDCVLLQLFFYMIIDVTPYFDPMHCYESHSSFFLFLAHFWILFSNYVLYSVLYMYYLQCRFNMLIYRCNSLLSVFLCLKSWRYNWCAYLIYLFIAKLSFNNPLSFIMHWLINNMYVIIFFDAYMDFI